MIAKPTVMYVALAVWLTSAAQGLAAGSCENFDEARKNTYLLYGKLVYDDVNALRDGKQDVPFAVAIENLAKTYARSVSFGDVAALRKLIGIGLFTAYAATHEPPLDTTFRLACELAKRQLQPPQILDPLTCAVIAIDGPRRDVLGNRLMARQMIDLAKTELPSDKNGPDAQKLFDTVAPIVINCSAE